MRYLALIAIWLFNLFTLANAQEQRCESLFKNSVLLPQLAAPQFRRILDSEMMNAPIGSKALRPWTHFYSDSDALISTPSEYNWIPPVIQEVIDSADKSRPDEYRQKIFAALELFYQRHGYQVKFKSWPRMVKSDNPLLGDNVTFAVIQPLSTNHTWLQEYTNALSADSQSQAVTFLTDNILGSFGSSYADDHNFPRIVLQLLNAVSVFPTPTTIHEDHHFASAEEVRKDKAESLRLFNGGLPQAYSDDWPITVRTFSTTRQFVDVDKNHLKGNGTTSKLNQGYNGPDGHAVEESKAIEIAIRPKFLRVLALLEKAKILEASGQSTLTIAQETTEAFREYQSNAFAARSFMLFDLPIIQQAIDGLASNSLGIAPISQGTYGRVLNIDSGTRLEFNGFQINAREQTNKDVSLQAPEVLKHFLILKKSMDLSLQNLNSLEQADVLIEQLIQKYTDGQ